MPNDKAVSGLHEDLRSGLRADQALTMEWNRLFQIVSPRFGWGRAAIPNAPIIEAAARTTSPRFNVRAFGSSEHATQSHETHRIAAKRGSSTGADRMTVRGLRGSKWTELNSH